MFWFFCLIAIVNIAIGYGAAVALGYVKIRVGSTRSASAFLQLARTTGLSVEVAEAVPLGEPQDDEPQIPDSINADEVFAVLDALVERLLEGFDQFRRELIELERRLHDRTLTGDPPALARCLLYFPASATRHLAAQAQLLRELEQAAWVSPKLASWGEGVVTVLDDLSSQLEVAANALTRHDAALGRPETIGELRGDMIHLFEALHQARDELIQSRHLLANRLALVEPARLLAARDPLCDVPGRPALDAFLGDWCQKESNRARQLSIGMIDLDQHREHNRRHGHLHGDQILVLVAALTKHELTPADRLYRFEGSQLAVLSPDASPRALGELLERVRRGVATAQLSLAGAPLAVTISCGVTAAQPDDSPAAIAERATAAVEAAKLCGRNRTFVDQARIGPPVSHLLRPDEAAVR